MLAPNALALDETGSYREAPITSVEASQLQIANAACAAPTPPQSDIVQAGIEGGLDTPGYESPTEGSDEAAQSETETAAPERQQILAEDGMRIEHAELADWMDVLCHDLPCDVSARILSFLCAC